MVLPPFYRLFNLVVKVFTKPILNVIRSTHVWNFRFNPNAKEEEINILDRFFINLGMRKYRFEIWMNYKLFSMRAYSEMFRKPLPKGIAWERGVDLLYDLIFYLMILAVGGYEVFHSYSNSQRLKAQHRQEVAEIEEGFKSTEARINELRANKELLNSEISKKTAALHSQLDELIEALKQDLSEDNMEQASTDVMNSLVQDEVQTKEVPPISKELIHSFPIKQTPGSSMHIALIGIQECRRTSCEFDQQAFISAATSHVDPTAAETYKY